MEFLRCWPSAASLPDTAQPHCGSTFASGRYLSCLSPKREAVKARRIYLQSSHPMGAERVQMPLRNRVGARGN
jgi:hypothetical protein